MDGEQTWRVGAAATSQKGPEDAFGTALRFLPVNHVGNVAAAPQEAARVAREIRAAVVLHSMAISSSEDVRTLDFSSRATASTSPSRARCAWPASSPARACSNHARARSSRCG